MIVFVRLLDTELTAAELETADDTGAALDDEMSALLEEETETEDTDASLDDATGAPSQALNNATELASIMPLTMRCLESEVWLFIIR
ncbi:MAG: hypothetical protein U5M23_06205 [Marinagarivorans sp.]|nr:hypothetical protein [Marinagarivorans sp.]